jgi:L-threonine kinase
VRQITRAAEALVPCTCGELVQGAFNGLPFLVSCPVDRFSRVRVSITLSHDDCAKWLTPPPGSAGRWPARPHPLPYVLGECAVEAGELSRACYQAGGGLGGNGKPQKTSNAKAFRAAASTLEYLGLNDVVFDLHVSCPLPPSKGFGTSTADVVGAIAAVAEAVGRPLSPGEVARLAVAVEPSDGTMFPGLALFDHRGARRYQDLGPAPPLLVVALDFEGAVDTEDYNARLDTAQLHAMEKEHSHALELLLDGLRYHRLELVGDAATASARANQRLLAKPQLEATIALGRECLSLGVCAAHSGTALGVLFAPGEESRAKLFRKRAEEQLEGLSDCWIATMVDGGARLPVTSARKQE